jgi:hypothetical protein
MESYLNISHIYRESNVCADGLANYGLTLTTVDMFWSDIIPAFIREEYIKNRMGMLSFRFISYGEGCSLIPLFYLGLLFCLSIEVMLFASFLKGKKKKNYFEYI